MRKFKKEKYIEQRTLPSGKTAFRVWVGDTRKTFSEEEYNSVGVAYQHAMAYRDMLVHQRNIGFHPNTKDMTIHDVFLKTLPINNLRSKTVRNHMSLYERYIHDYETSIRSLTKNYIKNVLNNMTEKCSDDTIQRVLSIFRQIDAYAVEEGYYYLPLTTNLKPPTSHLIKRMKDRPMVDKSSLEAVKMAWRRRVKDDFEREQIPLLLDFMYLTGVRPGEAFGITRDQIKKDHINIETEVGSSKDEDHTLRTVKNKTSIRQFPITPELREVIDKAIALADDDLLFPNKNGEPYSINSIGTRIHSHAKKDGIDFNLYQLRHRFATDLLVDGNDPKTIMELMGHNNTKMTIGYAQSSDDLKMSALENRGTK